MSQRSVFKLTVVLCLVALALCSLAYLLWRSIQVNIVRHAEFVSSVTQQSARDASASKVHTLLNETKAERENLETRTNADVISIVEMIERIGKDAGVPVQISNAAPENISRANTASVLSFSIQSNGTFVQVEKVIALLTALPLPSLIDEINLTRTSSDWSLNAQVRVYTTAAISL